MKREHQQRIKEWKRVKVPVVISALVLLFLIALFTQYRAGTGRAIEIPSGIYTGQVIDLEKEETVIFIADFVDEQGLMVTVGMNKTNETESGEARNFSMGVARLEAALYQFTISRVDPKPVTELAKDVLSPNEATRIYLDNLDLKPDLEVSFLNNKITIRNLRYVPPPFDFSLSSEGNVLLAQDSAAGMTFTLTSLTGIPANVAFTVSGLPSGVTGQFDPTSCIPPCSPRLALIASPIASLGNHTITISAITGLTARTLQFNLEITTPPPPPPFDFSLSTGGNRTLQQGASNSTAVLATLLTGTPENVTFGVSDLPAGATTAFSVSSCVPNCTTTLTVTTSSSTPAGTHILPIEARAGQFIKTIPFILTVVALPPPPPPFDFSLSALEDIKALNGSIVSRSFTATLISGTPEPVNFTLLGLPAGTTSSFNVSACTPSCSASLTVNIGNTAALGKHNLIVSASRSGINKTAALELRVYAPLEISLALAEGSKSVAQGASATTNITVGIVAGTPQLVSFSYTGQPSSATASFSPTSCLPPCTTTYTITSTTLTPKGTHKIVFSASGVAGKANGTLELTVTAPIAAGCAQNWECGEWATCANNLQSRSCYRIDDCDQQVSVETITTTKPETQRICQGQTPPVTPPPTPTPQLCTPEARQCAGSILQQCSYDGKTWTTLESCSDGCDSLTLACRAPTPPPKKQKPFLALPPWSIYLAGSLAALAVIIILVVSLLGKKKYAPAKEYIRESRLKGYGDQQIRGRLIGEGWEAKKIDKLLK